MTSSIAGSVVGAGGAAASYTVSKHGIIGLAKQIAVDYGSQGIRANSIQPAGVDESNLGKHAGEDREKQTTPLAKLPRPKGWLPIRRAGKIRDEYGATAQSEGHETKPTIGGNRHAVRARCNPGDNLPLVHTAAPHQELKQNEYKRPTHHDDSEIGEQRRATQRPPFPIALGHSAHSRCQYLADPWARILEQPL